MWKRLSYFGYCLAELSEMWHDWHDDGHTCRCFVWFSTVIRALSVFSAIIFNSIRYQYNIPGVVAFYLIDSSKDFHYRFHKDPRPHRPSQSGEKVTSIISCIVHCAWSIQPVTATPTGVGHCAMCASLTAAVRGAQLHNDTLWMGDTYFWICEK